MTRTARLTVSRRQATLALAAGVAATTAAFAPMKAQAQACKPTTTASWPM